MGLCILGGLPTEKWPTLPWARARRVWRDAALQNVILRRSRGGVEVAPVDPVASMQAMKTLKLTAIAGEVRETS